MQRRSLLAMALLLIAMAPGSPATSETASPRATAVNEFLKTKRQVLDCLLESFRHPPEWVMNEGHLEEPALRRQFADVREQFGNEAFESVQRSMLNGERGSFHHRFLFQFKLDEKSAPPSGNSLTMPATALLDHFFGSVKTLGFECRDTPMASVSASQYSSKEWHRFRQRDGIEQPDESIVIEGHAFVDPSGNAVLRGTVRGMLLD